jgi:hypothetical protein
MSNHFTGLNLGFPLGDPRLDLTDLFVFPAPGDASRTVMVLGANTFAKAPDFHPDAVYRLNIDNDGDIATDIAFTIVFSPMVDGRQTVTVRRADGADAREPEALGEVLFSDVDVSFGPEPTIVQSGPYAFFAGVRSDPFFLDFLGAINEFKWTGSDLLADQNVFAIVLEMPTAVLGGQPRMAVWGRVSVRQNGALIPVDRAGHPANASFFNTDDTKLAYDAGEPADDVEQFLDQYAHVLEHIGGYGPEEAKAAVLGASLLPDMLPYDPSAPVGYPNGRTLTDHVVAARMALLSKDTAPDDGLKPHTDLQDQFPYLGTPHSHPSPLPPWGAQYGW